MPLRGKEEEVNTLFDHTLFRKTGFGKLGKLELQLLVERFVSLAEKSRREGLLSLDEDIEGLEDRFMAEGLRLVIDGVEANLVGEILATSIHASGQRGKALLSRMMIVTGIECLARCSSPQFTRSMLEAYLVGMASPARGLRIPFRWKRDRADSGQPSVPPSAAPDPVETPGQKSAAEGDRLPVPGGASAASPGATERAEALIASLGGFDLVGSSAEKVVVGRDREIDAVISVLVRYIRPNPILVGEHGVGKTAIVAGLGRRIAEGAVPEGLRGSRIVSVKVGDLLERIGFPGGDGSKVKEFIDALVVRPGTILFLDDFHRLAQSPNGDTVTSVLKPALESRKIRCIAATTPADFGRNFDSDGPFSSLFQDLRISEPDASTTRAILSALKARLESHYSVRVEDTMLEVAVALADEFVTGKRFPDKAIDVLDRAIAIACLSAATELREAHLVKAVEEITGARTVEGDLFEGMESRLETVIIGQSDAIQAAVRAVRLCKRKLDLRPERPDGVLLFFGPSGVGKTELAKAMARELTGRNDGLSRIDMSEYHEAHSISSLLGSPLGYLGSDEQPILSRILERNPNGLLLLDEFEKAHVSVHRLFLQVFDEGRATDKHGRTLDFSRMTIIVTTNAGAASRAVGFLRDEPAGRRDGITDAVLSSLRQTFPVELLNRFDEIVPFRQLERPECSRIVREVLAAKAKAMAALGGVALDLSDACVEAVVEAGYRPEFGARGLARAFQELVIEPLNDLLLGKPDLGTRSLLADFKDGGVSFGGK